MTEVEKSSVRYAEEKNPESADSSCPIARAPKLRLTKDQQTAAIKENFPPGFGKPALRDVVSAGLSKLEQLSLSKKGINTKHFPTKRLN